MPKKPGTIKKWFTKVDEVVEHDGAYWKKSWLLDYGTYWVLYAQSDKELTIRDHIEYHEKKLAQLKEELRRVGLSGNLP